MSKRRFTIPASLALIAGGLCPAHSALAGGSPLALPPVREVWIGLIPGALLLVLGCIACLLTAWFIGAGRRDGGAGSWRAAWDSLRVECVARAKWLAPLWLPVAAGLVCLFGAVGESIDPIMRRPMSGLWVGASVACVFLGFMAGVIAAIAAAWCRASVVEGASGELPAVLGEMFGMITILLLLPQSLAGPCLIGFATGRSLGTAATGGTDSGGFLTVILIALLSRLLAFKPAIAATLILWLIAVRLVILLSPFAARSLIVRWNRRANPDAASVPCRRMAALVSVLGIALAGWLMLGNSPGSGTQGYPGMWWMLTLLVGGGLLVGSAVSEVKTLFPRLFLARNTDAGGRPSFLNVFVALALLYFAWDVSLQPAMRRLMPVEFVSAGAFFALGLAGLGFMAGAPLSLTGDDRRLDSPVSATVSVLAMSFVIALLTESPAASGKPFVNLSLMNPEVLVGLMLGCAPGRWLMGALHGGRAVLATVSCFALALALFSPDGFVAFLVAMTLGALFAGETPATRDVSPGMQLSAVIQWLALVGFLAVWLTTVMKHAPDKSRLGWVFLTAAVVLAWRVVRRQPGENGTTG